MIASRALVFNCIVKSVNAKYLRLCPKMPVAPFGNLSLFFPNIFCCLSGVGRGTLRYIVFFLAVRYYFHANICCSENGRTAENLTLSAGMPSAALFFLVITI